MMQHMQMKAFSINPLQTNCISACLHRSCYYSCIGNHDGQKRGSSVMIHSVLFQSVFESAFSYLFLMQWFQAH